MKFCKIFILLVAALLSLSTGLHAQKKHELKLSVGDMFSETLVWHETVQRQDTQFGYTPHYGISYLYKIKDWLGVGMLLDCQNTWWTRTTQQHFFNLSILPTVRFTYFNRNNWEMYSAVALGLCVNGGSETDIYGRHTLAGAALNLTFFGAGYHWGSWGLSAELGSLSGMVNTRTIFMLFSRLVSMGVNYQF